MRTIKRTFRIILSLTLGVLSVFGVRLSDPVEPTPLADRVYADGALEGTDAPQQRLCVTLCGEGTDMYAPSESASFGYRYGPTLWVNRDESIDAFFAAPGSGGEWDWITYKHSPDGGTRWTDERKVLCPTPDSPDFYSTCDPGAICFGGWYYIGYTSTTDERGVFNHVFVARSRSIDGPYEEKWTGSGWGVVPSPIVTFDGDPDAWGMGEPSFVCVGDTLYLYYTCREKIGGADINETRVATADAADENWPATLRQRGTAIRYADSSCDSADVKYVEDCRKFLAISTSARLGEGSCISFYESDDGFSFEKIQDQKEGTAYYCHNAGLSSRPNGCVRMSDPIYIGYAYGPEWGFWATRLQRVTLALRDKDAPAPGGTQNEARDVKRAPDALMPTYIGITDARHSYTLRQGGFGVRPAVRLVDADLNAYRVLCGVRYTDYDDGVIRVRAGRILPVSPGSTYVTAEYEGFRTQIHITVK